MKRIIALALILMMILCAVCALAETTEKYDFGTLNVGRAFKIQSRIPEGYTYLPVTRSELNISGFLDGGPDRPVVDISIAYSEDYEGIERFNDVDESVVEEVRNSFREMDEGLTFEDLETDYGTRLLKVTGTDFVVIYTVYKNYELEFRLFGDNLTDADVQKMVDFISDMDFVPIDPAA